MTSHLSVIGEPRIARCGAQMSTGAVIFRSASAFLSSLGTQCKKCAKTLGGAAYVGH